MWGQFFKQLEDLKLIPVVAIENSADAVKLAKTLANEGLPCLEVTFRTAAAADSIRLIANECPEVLVGAGTIVNVEQAKQAIECGAKFIVSPGLSEKVVNYCIEKNVPVIPGCATPTEITKAVELGIDVIKFFPAEIMGGAKLLKTFSAPFPYVKFVPTGGINQDNFAGYMKLPYVLACGGSWIVEKKLINDGDFDEIAKRTQQALKSVQ